MNELQRREDHGIASQFTPLWPKTLVQSSRQGRRSLDRYIPSLSLVCLTNRVSFLYDIQVLEDVTEYEYSEEGAKQNHLDKILFNGSNVCLLVPGSEGPEKSPPY